MDSSGEYENMKVFTQNITNTYCDVVKEVQKFRIQIHTAFKLKTDQK